MYVYLPTPKHHCTDVSQLLHRGLLTTLQETAAAAGTVAAPPPLTLAFLRAQKDHSALVVSVYCIARFYITDHESLPQLFFA